MVSAIANLVFVNMTTFIQAAMAILPILLINTTNINAMTTILPDSMIDLSLLNATMTTIPPDSMTDLPLLNDSMTTILPDSVTDLLNATFTSTANATVADKAKEEARYFFNLMLKVWAFSMVAMFLTCALVAFAFLFNSNRRRGKSYKQSVASSCVACLKGKCFSLPCCCKHQGETNPQRDFEMGFRHGALALPAVDAVEVADAAVPNLAFGN